MNRKLFLTIAFFSFFIYACGYGEKLKQGNETVAKVEKFRNEKGRLPNSLSEIGTLETENGPIYYRKESDTKYIIWFGKELGESATYDSATKKWSNL
jgi:hypothetical protein